jgi:hypothetical protein
MRLAALFILGSATADAQTIVLRHAAPATLAEAVFRTSAGKAEVQPNGDAAIELQFPTAEGEAEISAAIHADSCGTTVRIVLVGRIDETPPPGPGCQRRSIAGMFVLRPDTSLMIDLEASTPTVRIRQGPIPEVWFLEGPIPSYRSAPRGIVVHAGGGLGRMERTLLRLCGDALSCTRETTKINLTFGAAYWLTRWLGVEGSVLRLNALEADGFDERYEFVGEVSPRVAAISLLGGLNVRSTRFYGRAGAAYHRAGVRTTQVTYARTIDVGDTVVTFPTAQQNFTFSTSGWGPVWGAGVEGWLGEKTALFADFSFITIEGTNANDDSSVRTIDERPLSFNAGLKIHFGFRR